MLPDAEPPGAVQNHWKGVGNYASVGLELVLCVLVGLFGGSWLDGKLGTNPWLTAAGVGFGMAAGFRALWRALKQANREADELDREEREARRRYHERRTKH